MPPLSQWNWVSVTQKVGFPVAAFIMVFFGMMKPQSDEGIEVSRQMRVSMATRDRSDIEHISVARDMVQAVNKLTDKLDSQTKEAKQLRRDIKEWIGVPDKNAKPMAVQPRQEHPRQEHPEPEIN